MKIKVAIAGCGKSGFSFLKSIIFDDRYELYIISNREKGRGYNISNKYNLPFILEKDISKIKDFDIIILSYPINNKFDFIKAVVDIGFKGKMLIEKPLSMKYYEAINIYNMLKKKNIHSIINYQRRSFTNEYLNKLIADNYKIFFKISYKIDVDYSMHMLPHVLDLLCSLEKYNLKLEKYNLVLEKYIEKNRKNIFVEGSINNKKFLIDLCNSNCEDTILIINGKKINQFNDYIARKNMLELLEKEDDNLMTEIFESSLEIAKFLQKINSLRGDEFS